MSTSVVYATSSSFKRAENAVFTEKCVLDNGATVGSLFDFQLRSIEIKEVLEVSLEAMVIEEVKAAYSRLRVPCVVEHAGLLFDDYASQEYPGGLTKPMWNALGELFVEETQSAGREVVARAVVAYCDGKQVRTFVGQTPGTISSEPRGNRKFYWDTVFIPAEENPDGLTYAEIVDHPDLGLEYKIVKLSQSSRAMLKFLEWRRLHDPELWDIVY